MEIMLIRHGLPQRQVVTDGTADPDLSDVGQLQAQAVADWLSREAPVQAVYSSTMNRARQTAEPYAEKIGLPINQREGIVEFDAQATRYVPMEELKREDPEAWRAFVDGTFSDHLDIHQFHARVVNDLEHIVANHSGERVAVFCHGGVVNVWAAHVLKMTPRMFFEPKYTSINRFLAARSGERNLVSLNEAAHLESR